MGFLSSSGLALKFSYLILFLSSSFLSEIKSSLFFLLLSYALLSSHPPVSLVQITSLSFHHGSSKESSRSLSASLLLLPSVSLLHTSLGSDRALHASCRWWILATIIRQAGLIQQRNSHTLSRFCPIGFLSCCRGKQLYHPDPTHTRHTAALCLHVTSQLNTSTIALTWGPLANSTVQAVLSIENNLISGTFAGRPLKPLNSTTVVPEIVFGDGTPLPAQLLPETIDGPDFNTTLQQLAAIISNSAKNCNPDPAASPSNITTRGMPLDNDVFRRDSISAHYSNTPTAAGCIACNLWQGTLEGGALGVCAGVCAATFGFGCQACTDAAVNAYNNGILAFARGGSCCPEQCGPGAGGYPACCYPNEVCAGSNSGKCCPLDVNIVQCNGQLCCEAPTASCFVNVGEPQSASCTCPAAQQCGWEGECTSLYDCWEYTYCCPSGTACTNKTTNQCCPLDTVGCGPNCCPSAAGCANPATGQCCPTNTVSCGNTCCSGGSFCADKSIGLCCPAGSTLTDLGFCCPANTVLIDGFRCSPGESVCDGKCCSGACCADLCLAGVKTCPIAPHCARPCDVPSTCGEGESCADGCCIKDIV